jgi:hypothetical protein
VKRRPLRAARGAFHRRGVDFCNDLRRRASTTSSVRSSRAPPSFEGGGRRATSHRRHRAPGSASLPRTRRRRSSLFPMLRARQHEECPSTVAPRMVELVTLCVRGPTSQRAKGRPPVAGISCDFGGTGSLLAELVEHPLVAGATGCGRVETPLACRTDRDPRSGASPRRGTPSWQIWVLSVLQRTRRAASFARCVLRPRFGPRHAAPRREGFANEKHAAFVSVSFVLSAWP